MLVGDPAEGPIRFRNDVNGVEKVIPLIRVFGIGVDEKGVSL